MKDIQATNKITIKQIGKLMHNKVKVLPGFPFYNMSSSKKFFCPFHKSPP